MLETSYEPDGDKKVHLETIRKIIEADDSKMSFFGFKHPKSARFYAYLLKCLKDCYESKFEQLNIDLNFFLLLKNELSLVFLRNEENAMQILKT